MHDLYSKFLQLLLLICLIFFSINTDLRAQLLLERELIGAVAATSTVVPSGNQQELQVDASFGESVIGYQRGDIVITVGFHQTDNDQQERRIGSIVPENETDTEISVRAYPNPTVERLSVDLGEYKEKFTELRLIDVYGRIVKQHSVSGNQIITFRQLNQLPNANYFLQGIDDEGKLHKLTTVLVITY